MSIPNERIELLRENWDSETNDEETQEWRDGLSSEEAQLVDEWDRVYENNLAAMASDILKAERKKNF